MIACERLMQKNRTRFIFHRINERHMRFDLVI